MEDKKTIYDLKLHEYLDLNQSVQVLRVHGGFIYNTHHMAFEIVTSTFVPYEETLNITVGELPSFDEFLLKKK